MPKIFPVIVKRTSSGGGQGLGLDMGAESEAMAFSAAQTQATGAEAQTMAFVATPTISTGGESEMMAASASGSAVYPQGTETEAFAFSAATTRDTGSDGASHVASAAALLSQHTSAATNNTNTGSTAWTNPTNAQGAFNDTEASFALASGVALTVGGADLRCVVPAIGATPSGFTRGAVYISIRYRWELIITTPGVDTATVVITLRDSAGALISTLRTRTDDDGSGLEQATLVVEDYDITALVSEAQLSAGLRVYVTTNVSLALPTSGNMSCQVDGVHLKTSYLKTGIA